MSRQRVIVIDEPKQGDADATVRRARQPRRAQKQVSNYIKADHGALIGAGLPDARSDALNN